MGRKWSRILFAVLTVSILIGVLLLIFPIDNKNKPPGNDNITLRLRWVNQAQFAGLYWAQSKGIFSENGLDVEIRPGGPRINFLSLVASGAEDFGIAGAAQILEARDKGLPLVALAIIFQGNPNIFFSKSNSGIRAPKDWMDKTIAIHYGLDSEYIFQALLNRSGISKSQIIEYPAGIDMGPFFRDEVDVWSGYIINQPLTAEEAGYEVNRIFPDDYGVHVSGDVLFTTEKLINENPDLVERVVHSVLAGWQQALENPKESIDITLLQDTLLDRAHEEEMLKWVQHLVYPQGAKTQLGWMSESQWNQMKKLWLEYGGIENDISIDEVYDMRFVKSYYKGLGSTVENKSALSLQR